MRFIATKLAQSVARSGRMESFVGIFSPLHVANVGVCTFLKAELLRNGFEVYQSAWDDDNGWNDADVELNTKQKNIKAAVCKYSVSVHFNAYGDGKTFNSANGIGTYIHSNSARVGILRSWQG